MKNLIILPYIVLITLSFFLSGCYTQLRSLDHSKPTYRNTSWNSYPKSNSSKDLTVSNANDSSSGDDEYVTDESIQENGIFYKDYEIADWYENNYADKIYWDGYNDGFDEGYNDAISDYWDDHFYSLRCSRYRYNRIGWHFGWRSYLAFSYNPYHFNDLYWNGYYSAGYWVGFRYPIWGYDDPYYYGGWGYYGNSYRRNLVVIYNDHHRVNRTRNDQYYNGPRSTGLVSKENRQKSVTTKRSWNTDRSIQPNNIGRNRNSTVTTTRVRSNSETTTRNTGRTRSTNDNIVRTNRSDSGQSRDMNSTRTSRIRSSDVTNRSRSNNNSTNVRSNSGSRTRSSGSVRSNNNTKSNNSSTVKSRSSRSNSNKSTVRSSGSTKSRSSNKRSSASKSRSKKN